MPKIIFRFSNAFLLFVVLAIAGIADAQQAVPAPQITDLDKQKQRQAIDRAHAALDNLQKTVESIAAAFNYQCMSAVGNDTFCGRRTGSSLTQR